MHKIHAGQALQQNSDSLSHNYYVKTNIVSLLISQLLPIIHFNIPAKPMPTSVVTLKSCGFFMSAI